MPNALSLFIEIIIVIERICRALSLSMGLVGNRMASRNFLTLKINLAIGFTQKTGWNALVRL